MTMKKGQTWISAVLYIALGTLLISLILAAGLPVINNLRDRNTFEQTKQVMFGMHRALRTVINEGPGSQRTLVLNIGRGEFSIDDANDAIVWNMDTKAVLTQPGITVYEGSLAILTQEDAVVVGQYIVTLTLDYSNVADITLNSPSTILTGRYTFLVRNEGIVSGLPSISITST